MKQIRDLVRAGSTYRDIINQVTKAIVAEALVMSHGNQTAASKLVKMSRGTLRQYVGSTPRVSVPKTSPFYKKEKQVKRVIPWRDSFGLKPVRRGRVQVRFADGSTQIGKTRRFDWTLVKQWRPHK